MNTHHLTSAAAAVALAAAIAACGSEPSRSRSDDDNNDTTSTTTTTGSGMQTPATISEACAGLASRRLQCDELQIDQGACVAAEACFRKVYRDDAEQPLLDCYAAWSANPDCGGPYCQVPLQPAPEHTAHQQRCAGLLASCGIDPDICNNDFSDLEGALLASLAPCFDAGCNQSAFEDCVGAAVDDYLASCGGDLGGL
jgi:hypothetical protein